MKTITLTTIDARALHVLACHGKSPVALQAMDATEREAFAALCVETGTLVNGAGSKFRNLLREHYERLKATDADLDEPAPAAGTQDLQDSVQAPAFPPAGD